jgi:hypothetical protein
MSCRSTAGSSALVSHAAMASGLDPHETQVAFHDLRRAGAATAPPTAEQVDALLCLRAYQVRHDASISESRRESVLERLGTARRDARDGRLPDGQTFYAWARLLEEARTRDARRPAAPYAPGSTAPLPSRAGLTTVHVIASRYRTCRCCAGTPFVLVQQTPARRHWKRAR